MRSTVNLLVAAIFCSAVMAGCQTHRTKVVDAETGFPIRDSEVQTTKPDGTVTTIETNADGTVQLPPGSKLTTVSHPGYETLHLNQ
jgi:5-hydroxyisourate hydrolase-like protein (transthyretin family)